MKTLLGVLAVVICPLAAHASTIKLVGSPTWKVTKPDCVFELEGAIQNLDPAGTRSGTLKLALWAATRPFPARGQMIAEKNFAPLGGGYQIADFKFKVPVVIPTGFTGEYHFTFTVLEFTTAGWQTRAFSAAGKRTLDAGEFVTGVKWAAPVRDPVPAPKRLKPKTRLELSPRANINQIRLAARTDSKTILTIRGGGKAKVKYGSTRRSGSFAYGQGTDSLGPAKHRSGRLTLGGISVVLFYQSAESGVFRMTTAGRTTWGTFRQR